MGSLGSGKVLDGEMGGGGGGLPCLDWDVASD